MLLPRTVKSVLLLTVAFSIGEQSAYGVGSQTENYDIYGELSSPAVPDTLLTEQQIYEKQYHRPTLIQKIYKYFAESNDVKSAKKFDFSVIGGPYYSNDTKIGIGIVAAGLYRRNLNDTINPAGQVNLYGDLSITKYYKIGIRGSQYFSGLKYRMAYDLSFESMPDKFWGIGYAMALRESNMTEYKRLHGQFDASFLINVGLPAFYIGPRVLVDYLDGRDIKKPELWNNQNHRTFTDAVGLAMEFDTRDNVFNAYRGVYARLDQMFAPRFIGNKYAFSSTELTVSYFHQLWKTGVLAGQFHTRLTYGNTPWGLMSKFGGSYTMRGYREGRYNDKCAADVTLELRQHLFGRFGAVVWGGAGEVFAKPANFFNSHILWNAGVGIRWEFKHRVNVRVDYGFGQHENSLIFNINEAF